MGPEAQLRRVAAATPMAHDEFENSGAKLAALLGLTPDASVLVAGSASHPWMDDLPGYFSRSVRRLRPSDASPPESPESPFDLAMWSPGAEISRADLQSELRALQAQMSPSGTLLLLVDNRVSLKSLRRAPARWTDARLRTAGGYRELLAGAGFSSIERFLPFPDAQTAEELIGEGAAIALPSYASVVLRTLNGLKRYASFHEAFLFIASPSESGLTRLTSQLQAAVAGGGERAVFRLERFALRPRGALILFLAESGSTRRTICRITTSPEVDRVVGENARWTRIIHGNDRLSPRVKRLVPAPLSVFDLWGNRAYVEEQVPGVIAWKLAGSPRLDALIFPQICSFLSELRAGTRESRTLGGADLEELLAVPAQPWWDAEFAGLVEDLSEMLSRRMDGQERDFALSHGDFGYGNVLAEARTGALTGVIDWDQARQDLDRVDLVNLLLQRYRAMHRVSLPVAVRNVGTAIVADGLGTLAPAAGVDAYPAEDRAGRTELVAWSILRFVERDARYRSGFLRGRDQLAGSLRWALEALRS